MGVYDTVYVKCPHCEAEIDEQFKPGSMNYYQFGTNEYVPTEYLGYFKDNSFRCYKCKKWFKTNVTIEVKIGNHEVIKLTDYVDLENYTYGWMDQHTIQMAPESWAPGEWAGMEGTSLMSHYGDFVIDSIDLENRKIKVK